MILLDIFTFFGRMHPLIIHLPIGFLLLALIFDGASYVKNFGYLRRAVPFTLLIGFLFAAAASILGYMLSLTGDYDPQTLANHKFSGIFLTLTAGLLYIITTPRFRKFLRVPRPLFSGVALVTFLLLSYTGHQGANLTHGNDYITLETLLHQPRVKPTKVEEALIFEDVIYPMLERRCSQCHRADKKKGELSLENLDMMLKGGKHGPSVVPGDVSESELYKRITLDPAHEEFMPTDGKPPLTKSETEIIRWWIEKGMASEGQPLTAITGHEEIIPLVSASLGLSEEGAGVGTNSPIRSANVNIPDLTDMTLVDNLRKNGLVVRVMSSKPVMLDVTLPPQSGKKMSDIENDLALVARNVVWINFSDNNFSHNELAVLKDMSNLEKVRLEKNPIADGISDHLQALQYLEAVNLNETRITNTCLRKLQENPSIKRIYTWKTLCDTVN